MQQVTWNNLAFYRWTGGDNLGDAPLNDFLFPKLFPKLNNFPKKSPTAVFMGIGSILGHHYGLPQSHKNLPWIVFGSGFQYAQLDVPANSLFFALRGRATLDLCKAKAPDCFKIIKEPYALADPGILLPLYIKNTIQPTSKDALIWKYDWKGPDGEVIYTTRVRNDLMGWMQKLFSFERITTDSLHAALIADAYGIPWKPLRWEFKWQDHFGELGVEKQPKEFCLSNRKLLEKKQNDLLLARDKVLEYVV